MNYTTLSRHIRDILEYWKPAVDWKNGGMHFVMRDFGRGPDVRRNKCLLMHCRQLYDFSVGHERDEPGCRRIARHLYDTLDPLFGDKSGFYDSFVEGNRWFPRDEISAYNQFYAVVGLSRYARAFADETAYEKAEDLFFKAKRRFAGRSDFSTLGSYALLDKKTGKVSWKSGNAMLHLYEALVNLGLAAQSIFCCAGRDRVFARLLPVFDDCYRLITRRIFNKRLNVTLEDFDDDMTISMDQRYGSVTNAHALEWMGFMIEARWLTGRRHPFLEKAGRGLLDASFARADSPLGAFRNDYYLREGRSAEWTSFWAQVESTLTACFAAKFYGSPRYLRKADRLWSFYSRYFLDREFGGIFSEVSSSGIALDRRKGHMYKCDHHNLRMCEKIIQYRLLDA